MYYKRLHSTKAPPSHSHQTRNKMLHLYSSASAITLRNHFTPLRTSTGHPEWPRMKQEPRRGMNLRSGERLSGRQQNSNEYSRRRRKNESGRKRKRWGDLRKNWNEQRVKRNGRWKWRGRESGKGWEHRSISVDGVVVLGVCALFGDQCSMVTSIIVDWLECLRIRERIR